MKKNKTLRIALVLCVLAMFCAALVGTTFAKYVTGDNSEDTARVSKWGVVVEASYNKDSNFTATYDVEDTAPNAASLSLAVSSFNGTDNMVAPGTRDTDGIKFKITGTPEVATKVDIVMTINSDVHLGDYYPVVFTLTQTNAAFTDANGDPVVANKVVGNLATIEAAIETYANTAYYNPNTVLDSEFSLTWEWAFDVDENTNIKDTALADLAAGLDAAGYDADSKTNWHDVISYSLQFTVTQVN